MKSLSHVRLFATPWTETHQPPPSMGFSRQEYWSGLPFPSPGVTSIQKLQSTHSKVKFPLFFLTVVLRCSLFPTCSYLLYSPFLGFRVAQLVKNQPAMQETWVRSLGWEDTLEKEKATHSSILAWRIPWTV